MGCMFLIFTVVVLSLLTATSPLPYLFLFLLRAVVDTVVGNRPDPAARAVGKRLIEIGWMFVAVMSFYVVTRWILSKPS